MVASTKRSNNNVIIKKSRTKNRKVLVREMSEISDGIKEVVKEGVRLDKLSSTHVYTLLVVLTFGILFYFTLSCILSYMLDLTRAVNKLADIVNTSNGCNMAFKGTNNLSSSILR